jgi:hypothetical protein
MMRFRVHCLPLLCYQVALPAILVWVLSPLLVLEQV